MEPLKLKKDSWHYRLAVVYAGNKHRRAPFDICSYTKSAIWGLFLVVFYTVILSGFFGFTMLRSSMEIAMELLGPGYSLFVVVFTSLGVLLGVLLLAFLGILIVYGIVYAFFEFKDYLGNKSSGFETKEPGFLKEAFRSFKGKFCKKIEFKEDK
jgi:hypothetical protein